MCIFEKLEKRRMELSTNEYMVQDGILNIPLWKDWRDQTVKVCIETQENDTEKKKKEVEVPKFLGASISGAICGLSGAPLHPWRPYTTPTKEWLKMTGRIPKDSYNENMARGHRQEPLISDLFEVEMGIKAHVTGGWEKKGTWMGVSPDRLVKIPTEIDKTYLPPLHEFQSLQDGHGGTPRTLQESITPPSLLPSHPDSSSGAEGHLDGTVNLEPNSTANHAPIQALGKTVTEVVDAVIEIKSSNVDGPKTEWICQVMYQMHVVGVKYGYLCICDLEGDRNFQVYKIEYSESWWKWMQVRMDYFYQCLLQDVEPTKLRYIKAEMMSGMKNPKCEFGKTYPPLKDLKIETIMSKKI